MRKKNKEIKLAHFDVEIYIENLHLNWKPDTFLKIKEYLTKKNLGSFF
jgi:hypothetical protein